MDSYDAQELGLSSTTEASCVAKEFACFGAVGGATVSAYETSEEGFSFGAGADFVVCLTEFEECEVDVIAVGEFFADVVVPDDRFEVVAQLEVAIAEEEVCFVGEFVGGVFFDEFFELCACFFVFSVVVECFGGVDGGVGGDDDGDLCAAGGGCGGGVAKA